MTPERWQRVEDVFRAALARTPSGRVSYLEEACRDDDVLRREVASLLDSHDEAGSFLDAPAVDLSGEARIFLPEQLVADRFRIVRFLAEGGMGEVYEAFDIELQERVALKTMRTDIQDDDEVERRFTRESRLARKVSHPNVCRTFDLSHHIVHSGRYEARVRFITMELLTGETLAQCLRRGGPMRSERALPIMRQIAEALRAALLHVCLSRDLSLRARPHSTTATDSGMPNSSIRLTTFTLIAASRFCVSKFCAMSRPPVLRFNLTIAFSTQACRFAPP